MRTNLTDRGSTIRTLATLTRTRGASRGAPEAGTGRFQAPLSHHEEEKRHVRPHVAASGDPTAVASKLKHRAAGSIPCQSRRTARSGSSSHPDGKSQGNVISTV